MKTYDCYSCRNFTHSVDEGSDCYSNHPRVDELDDLDQFPSTKQEPCFQIDFWASNFAEIVNPDMDSKHDQKVWQLFGQTDDAGRLPIELEPEFEKLKQDFLEHKNCLKALEKLTPNKETSK